MSLSMIERQQTYDMHEETAEFLKNVEVVEHSSPPPEWSLVPIEQDKLAKWVVANTPR